MTAAGYVCADCPNLAPLSLAAARRHAREAGPVYRPERQTMTTHRLDRQSS